MTTSRILRTITDLKPGDHLGFLYQTEAEYQALLTPYLRLGLERSEKVVCLVHAHPAETILDHLRADGLDVGPYLANDQLRIMSSTETYLRTGFFNPEDMINFWRAETEQALAEGYQALRGTGDMSWALQGLPGSERLLEYESRLSIFLQSAECLIICLYDWRLLHPDTLFSMLATHPTAAVGTEIYDNLYYLPPVDLTSDVTPTAVLRYWLETLAQRKRTEESLEENQRRLQALFDNALDAILLISNEMRYVDANPAACTLLGYSYEELLELSIIDVTPPESRGHAQEAWQAFIAEGKQSGEYVLLRQDGTTVEVEFRAVANIVPGLHLSILHDITERKRAEAEIRRHTAQMEVLAEISQTLAEVGLNVQAVFETITRYTAEIIGDISRLTLLSSDERWFQTVAFHHSNPKVKALMESLYPFTPISAVPEWFAHILQTGQGVLIPFVDQEQFRQNVQSEYLPFLEEVGVHSILNVPLRVEGRVIGTLGLTRDQPGRPYTSDDQVLLQVLADRAALTIENARLFEQVRDGHERLQTLSRRLLEVQEAERRHIARELHDEIGQILTGLKLLLDTSTLLPAETAQSRLREARQLVNEIMERVDELSLDLRPTMLDDLGLLPTLLAHFERYARQTNIHVTFQQAGLEGQRFTPEMETTVFRLVQEGLTNVARHAGVDEVTVRLWVSPDALGVEIEDRGGGFAPQAQTASTGLSGMHERAILLGGQLTIESTPGEGTTITAKLPLPGLAERSDINDDNPSGR